MTESADAIVFGPFLLDGGQGTLLRDGRPVALAPKGFDLLRYLAARAGRLVSKDELLSAIWSDVVVGDASIKVAISEVRKALGDDADEPRYIQTVHRRGYRFIANVETALTSRPPSGPALTSRRGASTQGTAARNADAGGGAWPSSPASPASTPSDFVGRDAEIGRLAQALSRAARGQRQCVLLCGNAGSGKSALIDAFLGRVASGAVEIEPPVVLRGHCFEQFGVGEPYLPVWEAVTLCAREHPNTPMSILAARQAAGADAALRKVSAASPAPSQRLLRDMAEAIESLAGRTPVVFVLEDAHWADPSTLDLVSALARRRGTGAQLMVVVTYRPAELTTPRGEHPLREIARELIAARLAEEVAVGSLVCADVVKYLDGRLNGAALPAAFAPRLHQRTGGHALFLVHLVDHLIEQGVLVERQGRWELPDADDAAGGEARWAAALDSQVPRSVRAMIESQLEQLADDDRRLLEAAAVSGVECGAAAIAAALGGGGDTTAGPRKDDEGGGERYDDRDVARVEQACDALARRQRFLAPCGLAEWPNGTIATRFRFVHALFQDVVYQQIGPARAAQAHRALGERIESAWGERAAEQSAELAMHFERGRDWPRAARYLRHAADAAARQYAHREAIDYLRRALAAIERLLDGDRAAAGELAVLVSLGVNLQIVHGCAAAEVEQVFARAEALCGAAYGPTEDVQQHFPLLWGVWVFHKVRSELAEAGQLAEELLELARRANDPALLMQAHQAACVTALCQGSPARTVDHMRQAEAIYDPARHPANTPRFGQDPGVACLAFGAVALALLGRDDQAVAAANRATELARHAAPSTRAIASHFAAMMHQLRGDADAVARHAQAEAKVATEEGFSFWRAGGMILGGWASAARGDEDGIAEIRRGLEAWAATGSRTYQPYYLGLLGDALLRHDRIDEAATSIEQAIAAARSLPEGLYEAELLRMSAATLSRRGRQVDAMARLDEAILIARRQGAERFALAAERDRFAYAASRSLPRGEDAATALADNP